MDLVLTILFHPVVYLPVAGASFFLFLTNRYMFKAKKEYGGINLKMAMMLSVFPGLNFTFLLLNTLIFSLAACKYRVVKVKSYRKASVTRQQTNYAPKRA